MYEEWESEQYENEQLFDRRYALYTVEDLLGSLPIGEAKLRFQPGVIKVYGEARMILVKQEKDWREYVLKHVQGDWGVVTPTNQAENEAALACGTGEIISSHRLRADAKATDEEEATLTVITHLDGGFTQVVTPLW